MTNANCGCDVNYNFRSMDKLDLGAFFIYNGVSTISDDYLEEILRNSVESFREIGFLFNEQKVIHGSDLPKLSGLDVLLFFVNYSPSLCAAQFRPSSVQWLLMKSQVNSGIVPYDQKTLETNTGFVALNDSIKLYDNYLKNSVIPNRPDYSLLSLDEKIKYLASIVTHETAHAFAALDIQVIRDPKVELTNDDSRIASHIMAGPYLGTPKHFHTSNIQQMRDFIIQVQSGKIKNILKKRDTLLLGNALYL